MNILYVLQQSIYTADKNPKWLTADSNINMFLDLASEMYKSAPDVHFYCLIAKPDMFEDLECASIFGLSGNEYSKLYNKPNVTFVGYDFPINAFTNRYAFNPIAFLETWQNIEKYADVKIDVLWNNIVELTRAMKTTLLQNNITPKIISCNYWLDAPTVGQAKVQEDISYDWRQFDGFECSDLCVFTCESTKNAWEQNASKKFTKEYINKILDKSAVWDFGFLENNIVNTLNAEKTKFEKKTILFLNRLSGIQYTHHMEFISAVNALYEERQDFQVIFTNPSNKVSDKWLKKNVKPYYRFAPNGKTNLNRKEYFNLLRSSDISCHLFTTELYGGCAHREAAAFKNSIQIVPEVFEYKRIHGDSYPFYCKEDFSDLKEMLSIALDSVGEYKKPDAILSRNLESSFEFVTKKVVEYLNTIK